MEMSTTEQSNESFLVSIWGSLRNALIGCGVAVFFGLIVLLASIFSVRAAEANDVTTVAPMGEVTSVKVDYYLPYPGLLPDSPVYKLKMIRDWVKLTFSFGDLQKSQTELLFADKRIGAAQVLLDGGKARLAASTASKAEKYLEQSINRTVSASKNGQDVKSMLLTLSKAVGKHIEILEQMIVRTPGEDRMVLETALKNSKALAEIVSLALAEK